MALISHRRKFLGLGGSCRIRMQIRCHFQAAANETFYRASDPRAAREFTRVREESLERLVTDLRIAHKTRLLDLASGLHFTLVVRFEPLRQLLEEPFMSNITALPRIALFRINCGEFWSGDLGLTLISISLCVLVFVITPMREAGVPGRIAVDLLMMVLMVFAAIAVRQTRFDTILVIALILVTAALLGASRAYPTPLLQQLGKHFINSYLAPVCPHCATGDVSRRADYLEPHPGWS